MKKKVNLEESRVGGVGGIYVSLLPLTKTCSVVTALMLFFFSSSRMGPNMASTMSALWIKDHCSGFAKGLVRTWKTTILL